MFGNCLGCQEGLPTWSFKGVVQPSSAFGGVGWPRWTIWDLKTLGTDALCQGGLRFEWGQAGKPLSWDQQLYLYD